MTDATPEAAAPEAPVVETPAAPAVETPTPEAPAPQDPVKTPEVTPEAKDTPDFVIPDEHKDKPWAGKVKSQEDLYKQIDNLNTLVGKKSVPLDYENSTPEQIEEHFAGTRPEDQSSYAFGETAEEGFSGEIGKLFFDNGISKYQGDKIIEGYEALEAQATDPETYKSIMKDRFGDQYDAVVTNVTNQFEKHLSEADNNKLLDKVPNEFLGIVYQLTNSILKAHGVEESGAQVDSVNGKIETASFEEKTSKIRKEMNDIKARAHTQPELDAKMAELDALYQKKVKGGK